MLVPKKRDLGDGGLVDGWRLQEGKEETAEVVVDADAMDSGEGDMETLI